MNTIFVSIASYRDSECFDTIFSLYSNAKYPNNIFIGICEQNNFDMDNEKCLNKNQQEFLKKFRGNIRKTTINFTEAKGPTYARYLCSTLYNNEKYFLQIDSHSQFIKNWDIKLISMIEELKQSNYSKKPVLSYYPREMGNLKDYDEKRDKFSLPRICKPFFNKKGLISFMGSNIMDSENKFYETPFIAGGFFFCEGYFLSELPFDPFLPYVFTGEEILLSIRFFTNGWDIFTPKENIIFHSYERKDKPKYWGDKIKRSQSDEDDAHEKIRVMLKLNGNNINKIKNINIKNSIQKYGFGKVRSLEEYYKITGIDVKNKKVTKNFCRENNIATEEDIFKSNEENIIEENFEEDVRHMSWTIGVL